MSSPTLLTTVMLNSVSWPSPRDRPRTSDVRRTLASALYDSELGHIDGLGVCGEGAPSDLLPPVCPSPVRIPSHVPDRHSCSLNPRIAYDFVEAAFVGYICRESTMGQAALYRLCLTEILTTKLNKNVSKTITARRGITHLGGRRARSARSPL